MTLLIVISNPKSAGVAQQIGAAAVRKGVAWSVFFTNDGVQALDNEGFRETVRTANSAVACQESWQAHMDGKLCPVSLGSQTNNSAMVAKADRVVSF